MRHSSLGLRVLLLVLGLALLLNLAALAGGEISHRALVGSGGAQLGGGGLVLRTAIGQPAVGTVGTDDLLLSGGFLGDPEGGTASGEIYVYLPLVALSE